MSASITLEKGHTIKVRSDKPALKDIAGMTGEILAVLPGGVRALVGSREWKLRDGEYSLVKRPPPSAADGTPSRTPRRRAQQVLELRNEDGEKPDSEADEGEAFIRWARGSWDKDTKSFTGSEASARHPELLHVFHVPNGGKRNGLTAWNLLLQGVSPGVFDYLLDVPRGPYHGWRGELKRRTGGTASDQQQKMLAFYQENGYWAEVHLGWEAMARDLLRYLSLPKPEVKDALRDL